MAKFTEKAKEFFKKSDWSPFVVMGLILTAAIALGIVLNNTVSIG